MGEIVDLRILLKEFPTARDLLEFYVQDALLHWSGSDRERAKAVIKEKYEGMVVGAFMGDNQIFIELRSPEGESEVCYLRDMPDSYLGRPAVVHPFSFR